MKPRIENARPRVDRARVARFEKDLGRTLPEEYVAFLLAHNGGEPVPDGVRVAGRSDATEAVFLFLSLDADQNRDLDFHARSYRDKYLSAELVPIATDPFGNLFCLHAGTGADRGRVYFWNHEGFEVTPIAASFGEFFGSFEEEEDKGDEA